MELPLRREDFSTLPGWAEDRPAAAFAAFCRSAEHALRVGPYRAGGWGLGHADFESAYRAALSDPAPVSDESARLFFQTHFRPVEICPDAADGLITGYYEPEIEVRARPDARFRYPFLRKPDRLVPVPDPDNPPGDVPRGHAFMLENDGVPAPCPDRQAIETGAFAQESLEIAWAASRIDVFFAHVQGCARLRYGDGRVTRINYAAKSGHPFTAIGRLLIERGEVPADRISMDAIRAWLAVEPDRADRLMRENRSFIFFSETALAGDGSGPVGAGRVPLEPGRSLAVDHRIHCYGSPVFVRASGLAEFDAARPFARLMIAQDTGTAITGPVRGDVFTGSGAAAGERAGSLKAPARFVMLVPAGSRIARQAGHER
ncbi:murein transglycosylase A [Hoeflea olei]|uniref:peptidoglycan lytic exotransglycosylase n=1 Tax=Hoeflea olei TaxID=1480615 RepID=A0A1C1YVF3_9HYPH|nr:MltA domain-containing protein [Hoeflea olei]OCW57330.1 transglycosylase [Hoeflea olei]